MIDYVVMRANQHMFCTDVQVMRGAACWSDHRMVRAKILVRAFQLKLCKENRAVPFAIYKLRNPKVRDSYKEVLPQQLQEVPHNPEKSAEHNWDTLKRCIITAAEQAIDQVKKHQPDWFLESTRIITPLIEA